MENPAEAKKRGSKSVVKRGVVRLVTPGTLTEESLLDARRHNFLAAYNEVRMRLRWLGSTSQPGVSRYACTRTRLSPELARLAPRELILCDEFEADIG